MIHRLCEEGKKKKKHLPLGNSQFRRDDRTGLCQENDIKIKVMGVGKGHGHEIAWVPLGK